MQRAMVAFMGWFIPQIFLFSSLSPHGSVYDLFGHPLLVISEFSIPLCIGFAVLRYHLWDIDIIINKTLVYGTLTTILAFIYISLILTLQYLLRELINQNSSVAIVISTLVIAAIFQPLRHRIQQIIDRRFYRRKYDAAKTLQPLKVLKSLAVALKFGSAPLLESVRTAFVHGIDVSLVVAAGIAAVGFLLSLAFLPGRTASKAEMVEAVEATAAPIVHAESGSGH